MRTTRNLKMGILAGLISIHAASCGTSWGVGCTEIYIYGLTVSVIDDTTNQPICDAVVKAVDGAYSEQLESHTFGSDCTYGGAGERAGNYTISAMKSGYLDTMQGGNVVTADACHVMPLKVTLRMRR